MNFFIIYPHYILTLKILLSSLISFVITYITIPQIIKVSKEKLLFDQPGERKVHIQPMPSIGGLGIFAGFGIAGLFTVDLQLVNALQYLFGASLTIFFVGLLDDMLSVSPLKKLFGQVMASIPIIYKGGFVINSFYGLMGIQHIHLFWSFALTFLAIVMVMNSFNLIDGVDGLAGGLGLMVSIVLGTWFFFSNEWEYAALAACLSGSLLAFLFFNHHPAKIFMGDTGSLLIGTITATMAIHFLQVAGNPSSKYVIANPGALVFSVFFIPLFDTLRVFAVRLIKGKSPFSADRRHIHHLLMSIGFSHASIMHLLIISNVCIIGLTYVLRNIDTTLIFGILFALGIALTGLANLLARKEYNKKTKPFNA